MNPKTYQEAVVIASIVLERNHKLNPVDPWDGVEYRMIGEIYGVPDWRVRFHVRNVFEERAEVKLPGLA